MSIDYTNDYPLQIRENVLDADKKHRAHFVTNAHGAVLVRIRAEDTAKLNFMKHMVAMANKGAACA